MAQQIKKKFLDPQLIQEVEDVISGLATETQDRQDAVADLQDQLDFVTSNTDPAALDSLTEIVGAFQQADQNLDAAITSLAASKDAKIQEVKDDLAAETTAREAGDAALSDGLNTLNGDIAAEATARATGDAALDNQIIALDEEVQALEAALSAEATTRETADGALSDRLDDLEADSVTKTYVDGEVQRLDGDIAAETTARETAVSELEASLTSDIATAKSEAIDSANLYTDSFINELNTTINNLDTSHFLAFPSVYDFPEVGLQDKLYLSENDSLLHRFIMTQGDGIVFDWIVGPDLADDFATLEAAVSAASEGDKIFVKAGTYTLTEELNISKELLLFGEDKGTTIVEGSFSTTANSTLIRVSAANVFLKGLTFKQRAAAANFCVVGQTSDPLRPGDQVKIHNFSMWDCVVEYPKHGVEIRGVNTIIKDVTFTLVEGSSSTRYPLMFSHSEGLAFIEGCHFNHPLALTANNRVIYLRGSGTVASDSSYTGQLYIENNTVEGFVSQFVNHDNLQGSGLELYLLNNDTRAIPEVCSGDTNAFFVAVGSNPDIYAKVVCEGNKLENRHNAEGLGKGMFFMSTTARTTSLPVFARSNELANLELRATDVTGQNSPPALFTVPAAVDYSALNPFDFSDNFMGVTFEDLPEDLLETGSGEGEYVQVSAAPPMPEYYTMKVVLGATDLDFIDLDHAIIPESINVAVGRAMVHLWEDFDITSSLQYEGGGFGGSEEGGVSRLTWIGSLQVGGAEAVEEGDSVFITYSYLP